MQFDGYWDDMRLQAPDVLPEGRPDRFVNRIREVIRFQSWCEAGVCSRGDQFFEKHTLEPTGEI